MQNQSQTAVSPAMGSPAMPPLGPSQNVFAGYTPGTGHFDEFVAPDGQVRSHWSQFHDQVGALGSDEFARRWNHSRRLIYENGVAYNSYGGTESAQRPWKLDPVPFLVSDDQWQAIDAAIAQRATLLQLITADLLGPQRLLQERVIPPELLFAHPGFHLAYHGQEPAGNAFLHFYAGDLGRAPDGSWWLLADRTEAPSGIGFALENRVVLSRMLPEVYRTSNVHRLASFFIAFQETLHNLARAHAENPRVALLSRGPKHENYFEDAYLARYLGYTLVEGADLTVRDNKVWLKTLDGLLPVDVMMRRPNSEACDPLEFSDGMMIGVGGLTHAVRSGGVSISNPLGSGLVESSVFMAFMPRLCRFFLQQDLSLPGIATWWCGEPGSLKFVLDNLERLVVSVAYRRRGQGYSLTDELNRLPREKLRERILRSPKQFVAQEKILPSTAPVWSQGQISAESVVLRVYAVAHDQSYRVMQGGLARTSPLTNLGDGAIPPGHGSKDTWVLSRGPVEHVSLLSKRDEAITIVRSGVDLPSRVADNIYWMGRQIERADASARLLRKVILRITSETADGNSMELPFLLRALAEQGQIEPGYVLEGMRAPLPDFERTLPRLVLDSQQPGSLRSVLDNLGRLASLVRDRISMDAWRILVRIDQQFRVPQGETSVDFTDVLNLCNSLVVDLAAIEGLSMESMTRSHVFHFLDIGRRLERALQAVGLLRSCFVGTTELSTDLMESVLEVADSLMTYRSRYLATLRLAAVLDLLLTDETNPRSIAFQLKALGELVNALPRKHGQPGYDACQRTIMAMMHAVSMVDVQVLSESHRVGDVEQLEELLRFLDKSLPLLSNEISNRYLVHTGPARKLTDTRREP